MKLNRMRNLALLLIFLAFIIMYASTLGNLSPATKILIPIGLIIGVLVALMAMFLYFRIGSISMRLPKVDCPHCGKTVKLLGESDHCTYCKKPLRLVKGDQGHYFAKAID